MAAERNTAILLAAGRGKRMGSDIRKQYLELGGAPVFSYSLRTLQDYAQIHDIVVVVTPGDEPYMWDYLKKLGQTDKVRKVIAGGFERFHSVYLGLRSVEWPCEYVFIHDCARAFLDTTTLPRLYRAVRKYGTAVAAVRSKDTVRIGDRNDFAVSTPQRKDVWIIQTPQVFRYEDARKAHDMAMDQLPELTSRGIIITDDAMVVETMLGMRIKMVESTYGNIKLTTPDDLIYATALIQNDL